MKVDIYYFYNKEIVSIKMLHYVVMLEPDLVNICDLLCIVRLAGDLKTFRNIDRLLD